jgi:L-lactate dehydrogenase complex protein LldG
MTTDSVSRNQAARDAVLGRVRKALGVAATGSAARQQAEAYMAAHRQGPRPALAGDRVARFMRRATDMASTVEQVGAPEDIPAAVARYVDALELPAEQAEQKSHRGVCWPELALLDWRRAGLEIEARPTTGHDRLAVTSCFCAIAETGTLVFLAGAETPTGLALLADTHVAVVRADRIVAAMEDAFALVREEKGEPPRAVNLISGPSRTGDIEQTIVLGAHGPFRMHVLVLG